MTDAESKKQQIQVVIAELDAMRAVAEILDQLSGEQQRRVAMWIMAGYGGLVPFTGQPGPFVPGVPGPGQPYMPPTIALYAAPVPTRGVEPWPEPPVMALYAAPAAPMAPWWPKGFKP